MNYTCCALLYALSFFVTPCIGQSIAISELNFNSDSTTTSGDWLELVNYGSSAVDLNGWALKDESDLNLYLFPSVSLSAGARLVVVNDSAKFSQAHPFISNYIGQFSFSFGNDGDQVRLFDNSGSQQQFIEYADSSPWYRAADGTGRTLEKSDPALDPNDPANWFVGCMFGSPGFAFAACNDPLVFSEINYNCDTLLDSGDWCEIWNRSSGNINLNGWSFKDGNDDNLFTFPNNTNLAPDARLVLVHDTAKFKGRHPEVSNAVGPFDFNLSNDGELIRLFGFEGKIRFSIVYNDKNGWPESPDGDGYTLELLDPLANMNEPEDWFAGCPEGSPGYAYDAECNTGIDYLLPTALLLRNSLTDESLIAEIPDAVNQPGSVIVIYDQAGRMVKEVHDLSSTTLIDVSELPHGIYVAALISKAHFVTEKFAVQ